ALRSELLTDLNGWDERFSGDVSSNKANAAARYDLDQYGRSCADCCGSILGPRTIRSTRTCSPAELRTRSVCRKNAIVAGPTHGQRSHRCRLRVLDHIQPGWPYGFPDDPSSRQFAGLPADT